MQDRYGLGLAARYRVNEGWLAREVLGVTAGYRMKALLRPSTRMK